MENVLLEVCNLNKIFSDKKGNKVEALKDVNLSIKMGEHLGIVGESGSGKTTLAKILFAQEKPTKGEVFFKGKNIENFDKNDFKNYYRELQVVFQNPKSVVPRRMKIYDFLCEGVKNYKICPKEEIKTYIEELLSCVGLTNRHLYSYPNELSGGELQRVVIARALSVKPKIIIFDEPTSALDVSIQKNIIELINKLKKTFDMTIIVIAHDLAVVERLTDRVIIMEKGKIVEDIKSSQLQHSENEYTKKLIESIIKVDVD